VVGRFLQNSMYYVCTSSIFMKILWEVTWKCRALSDLYVFPAFLTTGFYFICTKICIVLQWHFKKKQSDGLMVELTCFY